METLELKLYVAAKGVTGNIATSFWPNLRKLPRDVVYLGSVREDVTILTSSMREESLSMPEMDAYCALILPVVQLDAIGCPGSKGYTSRAKESVFLEMEMLANIYIKQSTSVVIITDCKRRLSNLLSHQI